MDEEADLEGGVVAYLKTGPRVTALAGDRMFAGELPASETAFMPRHAIVVRSSGGASLTGESLLDHDTQRLDVFTYGPTPYEAAKLMRRAARHLRGLTRSVHGGVLLHWANPASGSLAGREPETEWPRQFQSFQVMHGLLKIEE